MKYHHDVSAQYGNALFSFVGREGAAMTARPVRRPGRVGVMPTLPRQAGGGWVPAEGIEARPFATEPRPHPRPAWGFPPWQPPSGNGLVAVVQAAETTRGWVENLLAVEQGKQVVWARLGDRPEPQALELVDQFTVPAATLVRPGTDVRQAWAALQVAVWLSHRPTTRGGRVKCCLTSWAAPTPPAGTVRIPHLLSISRGTTAVDAVVWELADIASARELAGLPTDWEFFDCRVSTLLELRAALRAQRLPATPLARRVSELTWAHGEELSIELVYREAGLFRLVLEAWGR
jgi:hypothetical protein